MRLKEAYPVQWWPGRLDPRQGVVVIGVDGGAADLDARLRGHDGETREANGDLGPRLRGHDGVTLGAKGETPRCDGGLHGAEVAPASRRASARARVREVLRAALGELSGLALTEITIQSTPGRAPAVSYSRPRAITPGISISHDEPLSLAAINLHGPVGVDLLRVQDIPDWRAVAHDYLGPRTAAWLGAQPAACRAAAFARAWSAHEARLKCLGLQLIEWTPGLAAELADCHCCDLSLPAGFAGALAWRD
jgi:4'-phosphopantetheinyl transferase